MNIDYKVAGYNKDFDIKYYNKFDKVVAVSHSCKDVLIKEIPSLENKVEIIYDIISSKLIENMANKVKAVVTIENHSVIGGLGGAVAEILAKESKHAPLEFVGVEDVFTESGSADEVKSKYGLNINNIIMKTENAMKKSLPISVVPKRNFIQKLKAFFK